MKSHFLAKVTVHGRVQLLCNRVCNLKADSYTILHQDYLSYKSALKRVVLNETKRSFFVNVKEENLRAKVLNIFL